MVGRSRDGYVRSMATLLDSGALGALSDAQLLGRFLDRGGASAEPAFEALVERHGPMVHRVCRGIVGQGADADDAFQATFLILACRAATVRHRDSLDGWLFGVARRVSRRARSDAARRRARENEAAARSAGDTAPGGTERDFGWLIDEVHRLPSKYREVVLLCDLQGLTYEAAAARLGCPLGTVSIRLKRARERLRARLERRGILDPAGLLVAAGGPPAALMAGAVKSSVRFAAAGMLAARFAPSSAALLAREVLILMNMARLKIALVWLIPLAIGAGVLAWQNADAKPARPEARQTAVRVVKRRQAPPAPTKQVEAAYKMVGSVRVEGTGEPVAGAKVSVKMGGLYRENLVSGQSGADGQFAVDLPRGNIMPLSLRPPPGYWLPSPQKNSELIAVSSTNPVFIALSPTKPLHRKDYVVRRGTVWEFHMAARPVPGPIAGGSAANVEGSEFWPIVGEVDAKGRVLQTLPTEGGKAMVTLALSWSVPESAHIEIEWATGFCPDAVRAVAEVGDKPGHFRLTDASGKEATVSAAGLARPTLEGGRLSVQVNLPTTEHVAMGELAGRVVDTSGKPIEGARVDLVLVKKTGESWMSDNAAHTAKTDRDGGYVIGSIPKKHFLTNELTSASIVVTKEGFAGVDFPTFPFDPPAGRRLSVESILLEPEATVRGRVVGSDGSPLVGAWIEGWESYADRLQFTRTDDSGRFTARGLKKGMVDLRVTYGDFDSTGKYLAEPDGVGEEVVITMKPLPETPFTLTGVINVGKATPPLAVGTPAPEWAAEGWSDGKARTLADYRGKVVVLDFWGRWCRGCIEQLKAMETLRQKYEPKGVVFITLHTPGDTESMVRQVLEHCGASLVFGFDAGRKENEPGLDKSGVTAERYGVRGYPTVVVIDRDGKIAMNGSDVSEMPKLEALTVEMGLDPKTIEEADAWRVLTRFFDEAIARVVDQARP
ncbi:sigma-70 family RNA polymerase sigma factor [Isosphaeraceae bacterium EP7]